MTGTLGERWHTSDTEYETALHELLVIISLLYQPGFEACYEQINNAARV